MMNNACSRAISRCLGWSEAPYDTPELFVDLGKVTEGAIAGGLLSATWFINSSKQFTQEQALMMLETACEQLNRDDPTMVGCNTITATNGVQGVGGEGANLLRALLIAAGTTVITLPVLYFLLHRVVGPEFKAGTGYQQEDDIDVATTSQRCWNIPYLNRHLLYDMGKLAYGAVGSALLTASAFISTSKGFVVAQSMNMLLTVCEQLNREDPTRVGCNTTTATNGVQGIGGDNANFYKSLFMGLGITVISGPMLYFLLHRACNPKFNDAVNYVVEDEFVDHGFPLLNQQPQQYQQPPVQQGQGNLNPHGFQVLIDDNQ